MADFERSFCIFVLVALIVYYPVSIYTTKIGGLSGSEVNYENPPIFNEKIDINSEEFSVRFSRIYNFVKTAEMNEKLNRKRSQDGLIAVVITAALFVLCFICSQDFRKSQHNEDKTLKTLQTVKITK